MASLGEYDSSDETYKLLFDAQYGAKPEELWYAIDLAKAEAHQIGRLGQPLKAFEDIRLVSGSFTRPLLDAPSEPGDAP